ncbi:uncharacterized protein LOC129592341 isoform X2 [Paramacrobiotus metropolitanus]|uniref:uncharacterized protein LOC129592341 isoform X2 n=1 Tax=Paramacrobiotus metropolitanus TaxID=2943436 RepID=UPI0024460F63|nr:uncharacterized protein LOC129592341 isoform X2 [Paramacrobiotus metropolitanus]
MHLYISRDRRVHAWNAVDVLVDGRLRHGSVVNTAENGLLVNLFCPSQTELFVEFGKIFDCSDKLLQKSQYRLSCKPYTGYKAATEWKYPLQLNGRGSAHVEVLMRDGSKGPWTWYPAIVLVTGFSTNQCDYAFVEVQLEGYTLQELVPPAQIRSTLTHEQLQDRLIQPNDFVISTWCLPEDTPILCAAFQRELEMHHKIMPISVVLKENELIFLKRHNTEEPFRPMEEAFHSAKSKLASNQVRISKLSHAEQMYRRILAKRPTSKCLRTALPIAVLRDVFQYLDTIDRQRCRRTCHLWNSLVKSAELCLEVPISLTKPCFARYRLHPRQWTHMYAMLACFLKFVGPTTKRICIGDIPYSRRDLASASINFLVYHEIVKDIQQVVFYNCHIPVDDFHVYCAFQPLCQQVIWRNCTVCLPCRRIGPLKSFVAHVVIDLESISRSLLWDIFEDHLDRTQFLPLERIAQWLTDMSASRRGYERHPKRRPAFSVALPTVTTKQLQTGQH